VDVQRARQTLRHTERYVSPAGLCIALAGWMASAPVAMEAFSVTHSAFVGSIAPRVGPPAVFLTGILGWGTHDISKVGFRIYAANDSFQVDQASVTRADDTDGAMPQGSPPGRSVPKTLLTAVVTDAVMFFALYGFGTPADFHDLTLMQGGASSVLTLLLCAVVFVAASRRRRHLLAAGL
jgi:hypothetical protein